MDALMFALTYLPLGFWVMFLAYKYGGEDSILRDGDKNPIHFLCIAIWIFWPVSLPYILGCMAIDFMARCIDKD